VLWELISVIFTDFGKIKKKGIFLLNRNMVNMALFALLSHIV
jgi:hypothetical protein